MSIFTTIIASSSNNLAIIGIYMFLIILNFPWSLCLQEVAQLVVILCDQSHQNHLGRCLPLTVLSVLGFYGFPLSFATEHRSTKKPSVEYSGFQSHSIYSHFVLGTYLPLYNWNELPQPLQQQPNLLLVQSHEVPRMARWQLQFLVHNNYCVSPDSRNSDLKSSQPKW